MKRLLSILCVLAVLAGTISLSACSSNDASTDTVEGAVNIKLSDDGITVDKKAISTDSSCAVYTANDIVFYPEGKDFTFGEGTDADTHTQQEADGHTVVHITQPGTYAVSGKLSAGQIAIDLGENAESDEASKVTLILNGADITCTVAPAIIFYNVYECGSKDSETASKDVDTSKAGANVIIADGTKNNINGSYVAKIYKSVTLSEDGTEVTDSKKLHKYDGAFYSKMSMNVSGGEKGDGVLNITAENEGLDSELHLTINGGNINIVSGNDGINTNEDGVSVTTVNAGNLNILVSGETGEGDGIDSNGWLVLNGGNITSAACSSSGDAGIDSDNGIYINGGTIAASGNMLDRISGGEQTYAVFSFASREKGESTYTVRDESGKTVFSCAPKNDFSYLIISSPELKAADYTLWRGDTQLAGSEGSSQGRPGMGGGRVDGEAAPSDAEMPAEEKPTGDIPQGERPEKPQGEKPERQDGEEPMSRPDFADGQNPSDRSKDNASVNAEISSTFTIQDGENYFSNITTAESASTSTTEL